MTINKGFRLKLCGDVDFEGMVIDVCYDDQRIASINYDKGIDRMEIEIFKKEVHNFKQIFPLQEFFDILEKAKALALKCAAEDRLMDWE